MGLQQEHIKVWLPMSSIALPKSDYCRCDQKRPDACTYCMRREPISPHPVEVGCANVVILHGLIMPCCWLASIHPRHVMHTTEEAMTGPWAALVTCLIPAGSIVCNVSILRTLQCLCADQNGRNR